MLSKTNGEKIFKANKLSQENKRINQRYIERERAV
jgi:hypothetical protein